jgi:hypothetical protein
MFEFAMVKFMILLLMGPFTEFACSRYQCSSERSITYRDKITFSRGSVSQQKVLE